MSSVRQDRRSAIERVEDLPRIQRALRSAIQDALARHKHAGNPVVYWRDGAVVRVPPDEIVLEGTTLNE